MLRLQDSHTVSCLQKAIRVGTLQQFPELRAAVTMPSLNQSVAGVLWGTQRYQRLEHTALRLGVGHRH